MMVGIFDRMVGGAAEDTTQEGVADDDFLDNELAPDDEQQGSTVEVGTPRGVREAAQELLKFGLLEQTQKPNLYRIVLNQPEVIDTILEPLDLRMLIDDVRGLAYVVIRQGDTADEDEWSHPLVRRQRLNLEQSLLIAILRQQFIAHEQSSGTGAADAQVALDDLLPQLQIYLGDLGSEARERTRLIGLLDVLKGHGLVSTPDAHDRVLIRPIIAHLANPENLQALLAWLRSPMVQPCEAGSGEEALTDLPTIDPIIFEEQSNEEQ